MVFAAAFEVIRDLEDVVFKVGETDRSVRAAIELLSDKLAAENNPRFSVSFTLPAQQHPSTRPPNTHKCDFVEPSPHGKKQTAKGKRQEARDKCKKARDERQHAKRQKTRGTCKSQKANGKRRMQTHAQVKMKETTAIGKRKKGER